MKKDTDTENNTTEKKVTGVELTGVKEIARRANVSIGTVDRVIHNRAGVSEKTRALIQSIIKELDYQPNILAQRLASKKLLHFAVLIPEVSKETEFWKAPLLGIEKAESEIKPYGIKLEKFFFDQNDRKSFIRLSKNILKADIDGVLLAPLFMEESLAFTKTCAELKIPYVLINSDIPEESKLCYIGPNLFSSGYLGGRLASYGVQKGGKILIVNILRDIDHQHYLLHKEEGFRAYFKDHPKAVEIVKIDIRETDYDSIALHLSMVLTKHPDLKAIFVTNSRVFSVARYLEQSQLNDVLLIGFDFLEDNIKQLNDGRIDFLICQKPQEQGYKGIMALYQHLILNEPIDKDYFMPIDIITKENCAFYGN